MTRSLRHYSIPHAEEHIGPCVLAAGVAVAPELVVDVRQNRIHDRVAQLLLSNNILRFEFLCRAQVPDRRLETGMQAQDVRIDGGKTRADVDQPPRLLEMACA